MNCRILLALVSITHSITIFPAVFLTVLASICSQFGNLP
jgi:hypothetical protein